MNQWKCLMKINQWKCLMSLTMKSGDYLAGKDEEIGDVIQNASLVYNNQLQMYWKINKEHQRNEYLQKNYLNQDRHHHLCQYDFSHKKLLLRKKKTLRKKKKQE